MKALDKLNKQRTFPVAGALVTRGHRFKIIEERARGFFLNTASHDLECTGLKGSGNSQQQLSKGNSINT